MSDYRKPLPIPSSNSAPFWEGCRNHELLMQRCDRCGNFTFPPSGHCTQCLASTLTWTKTSGRGKIYSYVVYHRAYHPGFEQEIPYVVALVELDEGPRLITNIVGCDVRSVCCDTPVEVIFEDAADQTTLYKFRPVVLERKSS
jgi:uncharacterized OB-fold protein